MCASKLNTFIKGHVVLYLLAQALAKCLLIDIGRLFAWTPLHHCNSFVEHDLVWVTSMGVLNGLFLLFSLLQQQCISTQTGQRSRWLLLPDTHENLLLHGGLVDWPDLSLILNTHAFLKQPVQRHHYKVHQI
jgi:hypothetical protein